MSLLDASAEEPQTKLRRYAVTGAFFLLLVVAALWWLFRFYPEKQTVREFLNTLAAGDTQKAYVLWKPAKSYSYEDFLRDWGPQGEFGPVKSFRVETAQQPRGASGVIVVVAVSPFEKFPSGKDAERFAKVKEVYLWVETRDNSLGFAPDITLR